MEEAASNVEEAIEKKRKPQTEVQGKGDKETIKVEVKEPVDKTVTVEKDGKKITIKKAEKNEENPNRKEDDTYNVSLFSVVPAALV